MENDPIFFFHFECLPNLPLELKNSGAQLQRATVLFVILYYYYYYIINIIIYIFVMLKQIIFVMDNRGLYVVYFLF